MGLFTAEEKAMSMGDKALLGAALGVDQVVPCSIPVAIAGGVVSLAAGAGAIKALVITAVVVVGSIAVGATVGAIAGCCTK